jgi:membrane-associated phospholipid phosphatase
MPVENPELRRRLLLSSAGFVALLALSVFWPSPVVALNALFIHRALPVDDLSFLGREAPSWDLVYWCLAGLFTLALIHPAVADGSFSFAEVKRQSASIPQRLRRRWSESRAGMALALLAASAAAVALVWRTADSAVTRLAEEVDSTSFESAIRYTNRFGGGMNPVMITLFFLVAGLTCRRSRWIGYGLAMACGGLAAGLFVQIVKYTVGRMRPEIWLGPFQHARAAATSFPSGHTVGAFAIAGVLIFGSRSRMLRSVSALLALGVGLSRILAFRHWASDVAASAIIGLACAWFFTGALVEESDS